MKHISKFLSLILRHKPETIGITLDENGWTSVSDLIEKMNQNGNHIDLPTLKKIVETNDKKRFAFNADKTKIRANQGHSIEVDLNYKAQIPPSILYHGTADSKLESIQKTGLQKMERHHVHLSVDKLVAINVGSRYGTPVVLEIDAETMHNDGHEFFVAENGVWLTDNIPTKYIKL